MILFLSLGAIDYQHVQPKIKADFIAYYNDQAPDYTVEAVIIEPPDRRDTYINLRLDSQLLYSEEEATFIPVKGLILARVSTSTSFSYGDRIELQGHIVTPPENDEFSYRDYLAHQGIYSYMAFPTTRLVQRGQANPILAALYAFRQHALDLVYFVYPDPEASLIGGILLGVQSGIPQNVQEAFRVTGTSHIIVISGFNITIVAWFFYELFRRLLGKRKGAVVAAIAIIFYTLLVGANPAVLRAAFLGILTLLGRQLGRRQSGMNSLAFAAAFLAIFDPHILWDVSFQLSFAATLGIMIYAEPLAQWFIKKARRFIPAEKAECLAGPVGEYFLLTLAAQLTTLPLMMYYFKRISLTALIANPLILPAQPALMVLGGLSILIGVIFRSMGQLLAWAAWPFTAYTIRVVEWLAGIPHGSIALGQIALPLIILFYAVLFTLTFARQRLPRLVARLTPAFPLTLMAIITVFTWKTAFTAPDGRLHVAILNVGTGEALLIQSPSGRSMLINGGASSTRLSDALGRRLPPFNRSLDWLVVAGIDHEDLSALPSNLERFKPSNSLWAGNTSGSRSSIDLSSTLIADGIPITQIQVGTGP